MTQARLNHLMIINYHQDVTDKMDLEAIADEFIDAKEERSKAIFTNCSPAFQSTK